MSQRDKLSISSRKYDLEIEDIDENELFDGNDNKRLQISKSPPEKIKYESRKSNKAEKIPDKKRIEDDQKLDQAAQQIKSVQLDEPLPIKNIPNEVVSPVGHNKDRISTTSRASQNELYVSLTPISLQIAQELREVVFGNLSQVFTTEWSTQSFTFCDIAKLKFGLVQKKGGPCGVIASVQAYVLLELLFKYSSEPLKIFNPVKKERQLALSTGIAKLLWKCSNGVEAYLTVPSMKAHFAPSGQYRTDGVTETLNILKFNSFSNLEGCISQNFHFFENDSYSGCILVLYSAVLTRSIELVKQDVDNRSSKLIDLNGYCTTETINLLIHGRAVSNTFNDIMIVDEKFELRGPNKRNDIGLLSLSEHNKPGEIGSYYKTPVNPIWLVCCNSHYSILFGLRKEILNDWKAESRFDLYYYDALARQDEQIKLTISAKDYDNYGIKNEEMPVSSLELVLKTKWKGCGINWNGTDPSSLRAL